MKTFFMRHLICMLFLLTACSSKNNPGNSIDKTGASFKIIDFNAFQIKAPGKWQKIKLQGIDSYVGGLTDGKDTLTFDFGQYSNDLTEDADKQLYSNDTINGKFGIVTKPKITGKGILGVYFNNVDGERFNLYTFNSNNEDTIIAIFQTIKFKTSDTTINSKLLKFTSREF